MSNRRAIRNKRNASRSDAKSLGSASSNASEGSPRPNTGEPSVNNTQPTSAMSPQDGALGPGQGEKTRETIWSKIIGFRRMSPFEFYMVVLTWSSLAVALSAAAFVNFQVREMRTSGEDTRKLANATIQLAQDQEAANRPWIGVHFRVHGFDKGSDPEVTFTTYNCGKSAAFITRSVYIASPNKPTGSDVSAAVPNMVNGIGASGLSAPGDSTDIPLAIQKSAVSAENMKAYGQKGRDFYLYAEIDYSDVFTKMKHWTHFCVQYRPYGSEGKNSGFFPCQFFNDTDDLAQR
ncbi:MAG TPA: hypothetical protein VMU71_08095 [Terracidiphilus sp.]|nr:hypothetical protein [Terracidiphilus sp.]